ncbi:MAG: hypothetical protein DMF86_06900 [Acidobacteria bacterium]|nr:MAG: hypothetical protein DMF86_06900 [Acidobacteriota bacterium]
MKTLSIVIPAYNEERFIGTLLEQIKAVDLAPLGVSKEIIVVDDCSRDRTAEIVGGVAGVRLHRMPRNGGKGRAVRAWIEAATGDYLIIQDADLADAGGAAFGTRRHRVWQPLSRTRTSREPVARGISGRTQSERGRVAVHGALSHGHRHRAEALLARGPRVAAARDDGVRAGSRDHGAHAGARPADRGSADPLLPAQPRRGQEDRPARLVHRRADVLEVPKRVNRVSPQPLALWSLLSPWVIPPRPRHSTRYTDTSALRKAGAKYWRSSNFAIPAE